MSTSTYKADPRRWCKCKHPDNWHDESGQCHAFIGLEFEYDCDCNEFRDAAGAGIQQVDPDPKGRAL